MSYDPTNVNLLRARNTTGFADVADSSNQYTVTSALDRIAPVATATGAWDEGVTTKTDPRDAS